MFWLLPVLLWWISFLLVLLPVFGSHLNDCLFCPCCFHQRLTVSAFVLCCNESFSLVLPLAIWCWAFLFAVLSFLWFWVLVFSPAQRELCFFVICVSQITGCLVLCWLPPMSCTALNDVICTRSLAGAEECVTGFVVIWPKTKVLDKYNLINLCLMKRNSVYSRWFCTF